MTDGELNGIEVAAKKLMERGIPNIALGLLKLIAEVRRLKAENERLEREHATYAEVKTDRNLELKERVDELTEEVGRLRKQRSEFEKGIRI